MNYINYFFSFTFLVIILSSCVSNKKITQANHPQLLDEHTFLISKTTTDKTYGFTPKNPVKVGGYSPKNERGFLNALAGPKGEVLYYKRAGSCCPFSTPDGLLGQGRLDRYLVTWQGGKDTLSLYINMYDYETLKVPVGLRTKQ